ncbi:C40 family peptidase [Paractinoplanes hotanensis]|uniref:C40 family peptidase n=1 Tax=Paractinoplanes hotanensis TaxID=2906497 RepID=A0ABT0Y1C8_9ACTN|nr:C40 family peptidase [Actinoplanes hotanensis]MCM4079308.1 C40 family peptidase [Actinoplanes hotanensis]
MATARVGVRRSRNAHPWWRPVAFSAVAATIAALFQPVPALADPATAPQDTFNLAVPDVGARPAALGTLTLPGQKAPTTSTITSLPGAATNPALQRIEKGRNEIAALGDKLIQAEQDRDLAKAQAEAAGLKYEQASANLQQAQAAAADAAAQAVIDAAGLPPGGVGGANSLDDLARLQRGQGTAQAIARQIELAQVTAQLALDEQALSGERQTEFATAYKTLQTQLARKQTAQQTLELANADALAAAEASQAGVDSALGSGYLAGPEAGRGADAKAIGALNFALAQRGDPYVWSEEGPDEYDCSGLMWAAYRSVGFQLNRVSRDQYWQTRQRVVSRYSLLPGDLLFFSSTNSWRGIHHVAMYAGNGMMVEAPRTGLNVRLAPVRWSRLFQATRVFGSIEGIVPGPELGAPDPDPPTTPDNPTPTTPPTSTRPPTTPTTPPKTPSTPPTTPSTPPTTPSTPPTTPSTPPTTPSTPPTTPSTPPTTPSTPPTTPSTPPTTTKAPDPDPTTNPPNTDPPATTAPPAGGGDSESPSDGSSSGSQSSSASTPTRTTSSANATESSQGSAPASSSGS